MAGTTASTGEQAGWPVPQGGSRGVCVCMYVCTYVGLVQGTEEDIKRVMTRINGHLFFSPV